MFSAQSLKLITMSTNTNPRILLLDDEQEVTSLYADILSLRFKILKNSSPLQALDDVKINPKGIDLIVTDYMMPGMSGEEFTSQIRQAGIMVPVVLCTAKPELVQDPSLFNAIVQKPFEVDFFIQKIDEALEKAQKAKEEASVKTGVGEDTLKKVIKKGNI
jgi:CheY-like chemotaxis protein